MSPTMGRKALFAAICWLAISKAVGDKSTVKSAVALDNESAESAPRLYRNAPMGIYASAVPYGSYSFHLPRFIAAPHTAASQVVPVKQQALGTSNAGFLKDSYGNRFVESPLMLGYKTAFPQEYLPLQKLPEHLAQPLVGASANFQFKQTAPQVFVGSPYRVPALQGPTPTPINQFSGFSQPLVYAEKVRGVAPNSGNHFGTRTAQQQSTNSKAVFTSAQPFGHYSGFKSEPKFQRIQDIPRIVYGEPKYPHIQEIHEVPHGENKFQRLKESPSVHREEHKFERYEEAPHHEQNKQDVHDDSAPLQAVPAQKTVTYVTDVNGKTTIVKLKTDPPVPLLDLTLLEPLTFDNPLVPQVQHFLPRIAQATYKKLPQPKIYYDSENLKGKGKDTPKKQKKPTYSKPKQNDTPKTPVVQHETLDEVPEISYEINQPNYKETYKEKALTYNKETTSAPVTYSYGSKIENEPVTYSYSRSSVEPQNEEIRFEHPQHLIYHLSPEEESEEEEQSHPAEEESESQQQTSRESDDDRPYHQHAEYKEQQHHKESPKSSKQHELQHDEQEHHQKQQHQRQQQATPRDVEVFNSEKNYPPPKQQPVQQYEQFEPITREYEEDIRLLPTPSEAIKIDPNQHVQHEKPKPTSQTHPTPSTHHENREHRDHHKPRDHHEHRDHHEPRDHHGHRDHHELRDHHEHRDQHEPRDHHENRDQHENRDHHEHRNHHEPRDHHENRDHHEHRDHHEPRDHHGHRDHHEHRDHRDHHDEHPAQQRSPHQSPAPKQHSHEHPHPHPSPVPKTYQHYSAPQSEHHNLPAPHIHEKSKSIIIKEETPEGMHMLAEKMMEEMIKREENSEEDFDKAYEDAAIGFPAYSKAAEEVEKDVFNPESYGVPPEHIEYNIEHAPFQQYQAQSDEYPKTTRLSYKDARDKTKENYYADYKVSKPESLDNRYRNKEDYYKLFRENKPDYLVDDVQGDKNKQSEKSAKYTAAPSHEYPSQRLAKSYYGSYKPKQQLYDYDYSKGSPRDNSAFASHPLQIYKIKTNFVEPQFQYGFEPISIPKLLDSELSAMASNLSPESEKPGMRKKIYKENWYIKQMSTFAGDPAS